MNPIKKHRRVNTEIFSKKVLIKRKIVNVITKFSFATKAGMNSNNPHKQNQDAFVTQPHIMGLPHCHLFAVCDGHGSKGREVSNLLKVRLPQLIEKNFNLQMQGPALNLQSYPPIGKVSTALNAAFLQANNELSKMGSEVVRFSGSTCVSIMTYGRHLYIANLGDSRAIIISENPDNKLHGVAKALTRDHKPEDPLEAVNIINAGGRIDSYRDENGRKLGPERVWLKN